MDTIISIIAVCVTLLLGVTGFIINSFIQRKSNSISVITKTRLARREKTKALMAKMLTLSNLDYLNILDNNGKKEAITSLAETVSEIRSEYTETYDCDVKLIDATNKLSNSVISYLNSAKNKEELIGARNEFAEVMDLYIQTEWRRIKLETVGKMKDNTKPSWDDIHDYYKGRYRK